MTNSKGKQLPAPLRDVFQESLTQSGGNSPAAFIAALDELDRRIRQTTDVIETNSQTTQVLAEWYRTNNHTLEKLPVEINTSVAGSLRRVVPELTDRIQDEATKGARMGAMPSQEAVQGFLRATERWEARKERLTRLATMGLPFAFALAVLLGFLFASLLIPRLPTTWQWPCKLIGAEHRPSATPDSNTTFCLILRE